MKRDVIIVGAGPAGAACAILLAREGFDVLLLDRAAFPRDKPCGEFITAGCIPILKDLGVWDPLVRAGIRPLSRAVLHAPNGNAAEYVPPDGEPAGWSLRRTRFDSTLVDHARRAGAEVCQEATVCDVVRDDSTVSGVRIRVHGVDRLERSCLVIGADGSHSLIARKLGLVRPIRRLQRLAIVSHWRGVPGNAIEMRSCPDSACGLGPLEEGSANVTLVVRQSDASRMPGRTGDFLSERIGERFPDLTERLSGVSDLESVQTVGCFGHTTSPAGDGVMLVGDAACFIDPFTGEGIYFALRGAELASTVAVKALRAGDVSSRRLSEYDVLRGELRARYRLSDIVQAVVRTPWLMNRFVRNLDRHPSASHRLMSVLGDIRPAADALNPRLLAELLVPA